MNNFLFIAAENDGLHKCKAGGMADVVRDVPRHIVERGDEVNVIVPSYGRLHKGEEFIKTVDFKIRGQYTTAYLYKVKPKKEFKNLNHYVIDHPEITEGDIAHIYHNNAYEPFYTDAIKFFIFCTAVAEVIKTETLGYIDVVHLHDWHTATFLILRAFHNEYLCLKDIQCIYSIHNLSIQGIRPFENNYSSLLNFFPDVTFDFDKLIDPRYKDCVNLMAAGIRLSDKVHTVSNSYLLDTLLPSNPPEFIGGEGLADDLHQAFIEKRYVGILNGVNYKDIRAANRNKLYFHLLRDIFGWLQEEDKKYKADFLAHTGSKILSYFERKKQPDFMMASVARLTEQKYYFLKNSPQAFQEILKILDEKQGLYVMLGTGDPTYEEFFRAMSYTYKSFIFINGQSEDIIDSMYLEADLYFMPSLFEPCGISQMLAMRNGTPCLAHATGGLKDTIDNEIDGFLFKGHTYENKVDHMLESFNLAISTFFNDKKRWKEICAAAEKRKFNWENSIDQYYSKLYKKQPITKPKTNRIVQV